MAGVYVVPALHDAAVALYRLTHAAVARKPCETCRAAQVFHTPCGWNLHKAVDKWVQAPACNAVKMGGEKMTIRSRMRFSGPDRSDLGRIGKVGCAVRDEMSWPGLRHANATCRACGSSESCRPRTLHAMRAIHND